MAQKRSVIWGLIALMVLATVSVSPGADTAPFSADISLELPGESINGRIFVTEDHYRIDLEQDGRPISVLVDRKASLSRLLIHDIKQYIAMKSDDPVSLMNDPFQSLIYTESFAEKKSLGTETVNGYACEKYLLSYENRDLMTFWVAGQLGLPIKIINHAADGISLNLSKIAIGAPDPNIFVLPEGYTEMQAPGKEPVEIPEWADDIPSAPVLTLPFERQMSAGDIIRIKVMSGKSIWVRASDQSDNAVEAKAVPFKAGRPLKDLSMYSNFAPQGVICERRDEMPAEADEIVIRVFTGSATIEGKGYPMQEVPVVAGENFAYKIVSSDHITMRYANTAGVESEFIISYTAGGKELSDDKIGPQAFRMVTLDIGEVSGRTMSAVGDMMIIRAVKGSVTIKIGQYDSFKW